MNNRPVNARFLPSLALGLLLFVPAGAAADAPAAAEAPSAPAPGKAPAKGRVRVQAADLQPFVAGTPWEAVQQALDAGDPAAAEARAATLELPAGADAALAAGALRARVAQAAGHPDRAAAEWSALATEAGPLAPWLWLRAAAAALEADDTAAAAAALGHVPPKDSALLRLQVAQRLVEAKEPAEARKVLGDARVFPAAARPEALALDATLLEQAGKRSEARARWRQLYLAHPATAAARPAAERMTALATKADTPPTVEEEVRRLEALLDAHANRTVIAEAARLLPRLKAKSALGCRARFALGKAHRKARDYRDAIAVLSKVSGECEDRPLRLKALYVWASASSILEKDPAIPIYARIAKEYPKHAYADDALFFIADLHIRAGRVDEARKVLSDQAARYPGGDYHAEALWRLFWLARTEGRSAEALERLEAVLAAYDGKGGGHTFEVERALYWKARTVSETPEGQAQAAELYARLFAEHPLSYHAAQGLPRLRTLDPARAASLLAGLEGAPQARAEWSVDVPAALMARPALQTGVRLLRLGLTEEAARVLQSVETPDTDGTLLVALLLDRAENPHASHWLIRTRVRDFDRRWPEGGQWRVWRAAYPLAFRAEVTAAAKEFGIPPDLLQAIIREESALQPEIVSWAGAVGLAQLMPYTARDIARRIGLTGRVDHEVLRDPQTNLRLSARYLSDLLKLFDGNVALAIASYNAGERTVMGWARRRAGWDLDAFVEAISIAETRRYTRRVLRSYATYRYLYGEGDERFLILPEKVAIGAN